MEKGHFNAESHLLKQGWTKGSGLGSKEDGIKEAIKVKLKFDQSGVGHNPGDEFTFHWWDHAFNKAASNIKVKQTQDGVQIVSAGTLKEGISTKKSLKHDKKQMLYGMFIKSATLTSEGETKQSSFKDVGHSDESSSDSDVDQADTGTLSKLTDDQLMTICEGRTAHKGARHGLRLSGKLARIAAQENQYETWLSSGSPTLNHKQPPDVESLPVSTSDQSSDVGPIKKKRKKQKREDLIENGFNSRTTEQNDVNETAKTKSKKSKHKTKEIDNNVNCLSENGSALRKKKKKKKKSRCAEDEVCNKRENEVPLSEVETTSNQSKNVFKKVPELNKDLEHDSYTEKAQMSNVSKIFCRKKKKRSSRLD